jgi:hypothetical protein
MDPSMSQDRKRVVTIVGGGASAHVLIPFLSGAGHDVQMLTRQPQLWSNEVRLELQTIDEEVEEAFEGSLSRISDDPEQVIPQSDIVVLCMPVSSYRASLHRIAPHLPTGKEVSVGTIYGQAGFNWMVSEVVEKFDLASVTTFAVGLIPWICRVREYGSVGVTYGCKAVNVAAVSPRDRFESLNEVFFDAICRQWLGKGRFELSDSFLSLTLSVDNQIIHPSRCFGLYQRYGGSWKTQDEIPYFYRDFDEESADLLRALDEDYSKVRGAIRSSTPDRDFPYMLDYLGLERLSYQSENTDIRESFKTSKTLGAIKPPVRQNAEGHWVIDTDHRFFTDDISYGVCIAKWMAQELDLDVPTIDAIIAWAQELRGEAYIEGGRLLVESESLAGPLRSGIPPVYGMRTIEDVID